MFENLRKSFKNAKEFTDSTGSAIKNHTGHSIKSVFTGNILRSEAAKGVWPMVFILVVFIFCKIGIRYSCEDAIVKIEKLDKKLVEVSNESKTLSAELLGQGKQSKVEGMLHGNSLSVAKNPPYVIKK